ncbi:MAG: hypothetical protein QOI57_2996, partial [Rubrobacteraceae bacterium]|nr:hypothetical protein [Rubrobacteraceae bacterium]
MEGSEGTKFGKREAGEEYEGVRTLGPLDLPLL